MTRTDFICPGFDILVRADAQQLIVTYSQPTSPFLRVPEECKLVCCIFFHFPHGLLVPFFKFNWPHHSALPQHFGSNKIVLFWFFWGFFFRKMIAYTFKKCWRKERTGHKEQLFPVKGERAVCVLEHMA